MPISRCYPQSADYRQILSKKSKQYQVSIKSNIKERGERKTISYINHSNSILSASMRLEYPQFTKLTFNCVSYSHTYHKENYSIDGSRGQSTQNCNKRECCVEQDQQEEFSIMESYAIINPGAVMIHIQNASVTHRAMMASLRFKYMTNQAISPLFDLDIIQMETLDNGKRKCQAMAFCSSSESILQKLIPVDWTKIK